jgi:AMMECR1 domain-containing protein
LLLPQVASERRWSAKRFAEEVCRKAGLEPGAWRDHETQIFAFTVEAFSEAELRHAPAANYSIST